VYILVSAYSDPKCSPNTTQHGTLSLSPDVKWSTLKPRLQDTTGCQTGCQTGLTTGLTTLLNEQLFVRVRSTGCQTGCTTGLTGCTTGLTTGCIM